MARTNDRARALARAKLERQRARRAAAARRRRQIQAGTAAGLALVLLVLGALWFSGVFESEDKKPTAGQDCAWKPETGAGAKDAGSPSTGGIARSGTQTMTITTNQGIVEASIDAAKVPCTAASFTHLAGKKFFDGTKCHRLTNAGIFVLQCGDPSGTGSGGPTYRFADENLPTPPAGASAGASASAASGPLYKRGTLAMANSGPDTNGSQFFIVYQDSTLDPKYTVLGTVTNGLDVVEKVAAGGIAAGGSSANDGKPNTEVTIQSLTMSAPAAGPAASAPASAGTSAPPA